MVLLEPLLDLLIPWQSSTSFDSILTSISERIAVTVDSRSEFWTLSGIPEITKLFLVCTGVEPPTKFSKSKGLTGSQILDGVTFFRGEGCSFYIKIELKSEIFNDNKSL